MAGFWRIVLQSSVEFQFTIEEHDEPVLDYLCDIQSEWLEADNRDAGFRIRFVFDSNPYFLNTVLEKLFYTKRKNVYVDTLVCVRITSSKIQWHPGKDATVEVVAKTKKGLRKQNAKPRTVEVPRTSLFRTFFRNLVPGEGVPEAPCEDSDADEDSDTMAESFIKQDYEDGVALRDYLIPHAVRWYTGEACEEEDEAEEAEGDVQEELGAAHQGVEVPLADNLIRGPCDGGTMRQDDFEDLGLGTSSDEDV